MIDPRLRTLRVLRSQQTVTATAASLHLTPSTVSQQLKQLAGELGVKLLEPDGRRVRLTPAAELVLDHADALFQRWEQARSDLSAFHDGQLGRIRFAGMPSVVAGIIVPAVMKLNREHPGISTHMSTHESPDCFRLLLSGDVDVAIVAEAVGTPSDEDLRFEQRHLLNDVEDLLVPAGHPWVTAGSVTLAETAQEDWIALTDCLDQHHLMVTSAARAGFAPRFRHSAGDWHSAAAMVAGGFGISLVPRLAALQADLPVARVPLSGDVIPVRYFNIAIRNGSHEQPAIRHAVAALRAVVEAPAALAA
ncbi:DNA-binding transcriptional LysR family regulator [Stackebrandtia endophytica]|uniref:DNA-binding transcriptional LysR family regulator n=1 Tax=Stackebrandtia endophytica TaxID=1496996 RepID=A0A543AWJ6_9ACTN|nr:LysR family transcriptional regulator [Stackebrandtia endophytica]TQL76942.1 DNA-binding transcriptional LysR family regulator [Stackebrandtia endophytica]